MSIRYFNSLFLTSTLYISQLCFAEPVINIYPAVNAVNEAGENISDYPNLPKELITAVNVSHGLKSIALSPDGEFLLTGDTNGAINIWNNSNGELLERIEAHTEHVDALVFHPNGRVFASGSSSTDGTIKLWDLHTAQLLQTIGKQANEDEYDDSDIGVKKLIFTKDASRLFAAVSENSGNNRIDIYDSKTGQTIRQFEVGEEQISDFSLNSDESAFVAKTYNGLALWNIDADKPSEVLSELDSSPHTLAFSDNGQYLVAKQYSAGCVQLWELDTRTTKIISPIELLEGDTKQTDDLAIDCLDPETISAIQVIEEEDSYFYDAISFHPNGELFAYIDRNDSVSIWNKNTNDKIENHSYFAISHSAQAYHPNGKILAVGQNKGSVSFWNTETNTLTSTMKIDDDDGGRLDIKRLSYSSNGDILSILTAGGVLINWDTEQDTVRDIIYGDIDLMAFDPASSKYAYASNECGESEGDCIIIRDYNKSDKIHTLELGELSNRLDSLTYSHDGKTIVASRIDEIIKAWNTATWDVVKSIKTGQDDYVDSYVMPVQISPDGQYFAGIQPGHNIDIRKIGGDPLNSSWEIIKEIDEWQFSFSADSKQFAATEDGHGYIEFWDTSTWNSTGKIPMAESMETYNLQYNPNGQTISVVGDGIVKVFDLTTQKLVANLISGPKGHWLKYTELGTFWHSGAKNMIPQALMQQ